MANRRTKPRAKPAKATRRKNNKETGSRAAPRNRRVARKRPQVDQSSERPAMQPTRPLGSRSLGSKVYQEVVAVLLCCAGLLTLLAVITYHPADASLNASGGSAQVHNWIGPAGGYWADLLLQTFGVGAYPLGLGLLLSGVRAFSGKRIAPGAREAAGGLLLVVCVGAFAHVLLRGVPRPYPPGGIAGAILGSLLLEQFAVLGAYILSGALALVSLALTADGVLAGLGLRGLGALRDGAGRLHAAFVVYQERRRRLAEHRRQEVREVERATHWTFGELPTSDERRERKEARLEEARERGRALADREQKERKARAKKRAVRPVSEPELPVSTGVDLPDEEVFELGDIPPMTPTLEPPPIEPAPAPADEIELAPEDVSIDVPIRAASPEDVKVIEPTPADAMVAPAEIVEDTEPEPKPKPKRVVGERKRKGPADPQIVDVRPDIDADAVERAAAEVSGEQKVDRTYELPSPMVLDFPQVNRQKLDPEQLRENAGRLTKTLRNYGIEGHVREIRPGPVITMYEFVPGPGIKISKIANLADDLAMSMEALRVRIVAPIPGKGAVGIEIPNESVETVYLKELIAHDDFRKPKTKLPMALGKDIEGKAYIADLPRMPHLLVAGATGAGKSVSLNAMIMSILFKATPEQVRLIMIDPKMLELSVYEGIPHLLLPVVTDPKKASMALRWAVEEMERRYQLLSALGVRNIDGYNTKVQARIEADEPAAVTIKHKGGREEQIECEHLPTIVVIVDELADLMMVASREVESSIMRLAQMARAAGIHLILATQRPSVDVLTGVIKANFPTRIAFQVASKHDSRTILDGNGAEHLLGRGDMLFLSPGAGGITRVHGAYVSEPEIERTVAFLKEQGEPEYDESILAPRDDEAGPEEDDSDKDEMYDMAVAIVLETRQASISMIQRRLRIGYNRAARMVEVMEREGLVGPADGGKPREVLVPEPTV